MSNTIVSLNERRRKKEWDFEKKILRTLSIKDIQSISETFFIPVFPNFHFQYSFMEDACVDLAIDSFLLGAKYSRLGVRGEDDISIKERANREVKFLVKELYNFMYGWVHDPQAKEEKMFEAVDGFVVHWWEKGFETGKTRLLLRLQ
ncbi:DUF2521 family protein [Bacillus sp. FJAT-44742]|uniref:DUF2521 family protein n=1 Tax=Bacillus sp. FJAT-44742 TaxID=2014005 RepID=UPI0012FF1BEC|nr:DUF2521 family protein [Bacillus sp. FJAT-44742]